jgi:hypothetical protein
VLSADGKVYALNGRAMGNAKERAYLDSRNTIQLWKIYSVSGENTIKYKDKIFVGRPGFVKYQEDLYTTPVSDPGIIKRGLAMCE